MCPLKRRRGRVLVVDDDPIIAELIRGTLAEHGFATRTAADGREALYLVERDRRGWFTRRAQRRHDWPDDVFGTQGRIAVASAAALAGFRQAHRRAA